MPLSLPVYPVSEVLADLLAALAQGTGAILSAPPGAGKTSLVPLALLDADWRMGGKILLLEPRRLAARAAASRMAQLLGESVGRRVGYRMRLDTRISAETVIEVVTEGVFARMILDDPELTGVAAVLFDEFHERSLDADLGLALALDVQAALRPDLRLVVMSATLDMKSLATLMPVAPIIESRGRAFAVAHSYRPRDGNEAVERAVTRAITEAWSEEEGSILAFLPGQREITRTAEALEAWRLRAGIDTMLIAPLYGNLSQAEQDQAIRPAPAGQRKIVLATSIAETSITIDGVRIVIDSGLRRSPVFEPATGITRLETRRISKAAADQRAGRAGRTEPGVAIRLWHEGQNAALEPHTPPEILATDLSGLLLDLLAWGVDDPGKLGFLDQPPDAGLNEARALLAALGAIDGTGGLTAKGRAIRALALPPRLAAMVVDAESDADRLAAAELAVLLTEQGLGGPSVDLDQRLSRFRSDRAARAEKARGLARSMARAAGAASASKAASLPAGGLLLHAFPDRVALRRGGGGRFVMANGRGCAVDEGESLARAEMIVVADLTGRAETQRVLSAAEIDRATVEQVMAHTIQRGEEVWFDNASRQVRARRVTRLGAILFEQAPLSRPRGAEAERALLEGIRSLGLSSLPFSKPALQARQRIGFLHRALGAPWPEMEDDTLLATLETWFLPYQPGVAAYSEIDPGALTEGLMSLVPASLRRDLEKLAPTHFESPAGNRHPVDYSGEEPQVTIRVQELFGLKQHPAIGGGRLPLVLELTSPAHRPIQKTRDLIGFWAGSWKDVRADMRGRYPKHPWPENPADAEPTSRAKPRGT